MPIFLSKQLVAIQLILILSIASESHAQPAVVCKPADIQGLIVDEMGKPISGARVLVQNSPYTQDVEWYATRPEEDLLIGDATSDADGRYRIRWLVDKISPFENGNVNADILVMKPSHAIAFRQTSLWNDEFYPFKLAPDVEHFGKVLDDNGNPLADAEVSLDSIYRKVELVDRGAVFSSEPNVCSMLSSSLRPRAKTDKDGNYRLPGLASGQIALLQVSHPKFPSIRRMQPADENSPEAIQERTGDDPIFTPWYNSYRKPLQMEPGKLGKMVAVEESSQKPVANLEVCLGSSGMSIKSDQNGLFEYWLPSDAATGRAFRRNEYYVRRAGDLRWSPASLMQDGDKPAKLFSPIQRTITGQVRDKETSHGIEGVGVYVLHSRDKKSWTITDREGRFKLSAENRHASIAVNGPVMGYDLPVSRLTNAAEEPSRKLDTALHQRQIFFPASQTRTEVNFEIPKYPKVRVRIEDQNGKPVRGTQVKLLANVSWVSRSSTATSNDEGIAEFEIDRPIIKSTAWVANEAGFGAALIEGMPESVITLTVVPAIAIPGHLTAKSADGKQRNAAGIPIRLRHATPRVFAQMDLATTDRDGNFTVYLPAGIEDKAKLFVPSVHSSSNYGWTVEVSEGANADFVMNDDRLP